MPADGGPCPVCTLPSAAAGGPAAEGAPGLVAGRYLLQRRLGRGAAKDVWLAHDLTLDRAVALARVGGPSAWERLRREARLTARLGGHRHIVTVHDVFDDAGTPCLVARYMTGGSLADRLARAPGNRLTVDEAIRAAREIAGALAHAHAHGVVHRDVKPDNVWLDADGEAALGDFGVALEPGEAGDAPAGTPLYSPPEQAAGEAATPRSDLYALGVTLYELLCGRRPYRATQLASRRPPAPPSSMAAVPEGLDQLVLSLLSHDPAERPESAAAVAAALGALLAPAHQAPAPTPGLVGRVAELERLRGTLARAWAGAPALVLLAGDAGIGKTTLLAALASEAERRGGLAVWGRGEPEGRAYRLWRPVVRALAAAAPGEPDGALARFTGDVAEPGGEEERLRLFDAVADLLAAAAAERPLLVLLEDLHWSDASSLRLLAHVAGGDQGSRFLLAGSYRTGEAPALDVTAERLELGGLGLDEVRALLPPTAPAEDIHARTGGNPFFVAELGRLGDVSVPESVREVVSRRVAQLGPQARRVLEAGAVAGTFTVADLVRASGAPRADVVAALDRGTAARIVVPDEPGHFAFAHAIVRDAIREALPQRRRSELHDTVAAALRARRDAGADVAAARLAHHALAAARGGAEPQPAWELALEAAGEAAAALGHAEAAIHYGEALEALALGAEAPVRARRDALLAYADATFAAGDVQDARRRYTQAAAAARRDADAEAFTHAALRYTQVNPYGVVDTDGIALLEEALTLLPDADGPLRARATGRLAVLVPDQARREDLIDEALAMGRRLDDEATLGWLYPAAMNVDWRPERAVQRAAAAAEVVRAAAQHADHAGLIWAYVHVIRDAMQAGDVAAADRALDRARPVAHATRRSVPRWFLMTAETARAAFAGRLDEAERMSEEALAINRRLSDDCLQEYTVQQLVLARLRWRSHEAEAAQLGGFAARYPALPVWEAMLAALEAAVGNADAARRGVELCARDDFAAVIRSRDFLPAAVNLGEAAAVSGTHVEQLYALLAPHAAVNPVLDHMWAAWGPVARVLGLLAAADDRPGDAAEHFAHALALCEAWSAPAWALRTIGDWLATGVPAPDRAALVHHALVLTRELGLPGVAARINDVQPGGAPLAGR